MSDINVTVVGAAVAISIAGQPIGVTTVGQQGPSGPAVPALSDTFVLFSKDNQVSASNKFTFDPLTNVLAVTGDITASTYLHHASGSAALTAAGLQAGSGHAIGFSDIANATGTLDTKLVRDAAGALALKNGANRQTFRLYDSDDGAGNYYRGFVRFVPGGVLEIGNEAAGTGVVSSMRVGTWGSGTLYFRTNSVDRWHVQGNGAFAATVDNTYDIGNAGNFRPRSGYFATSVDTPRLVVRSSSGSGSPSLYANTSALEQRDGGVAQAFRVYETYTDDSNYSRGFIRFASGQLQIGAEAAGTGVVRPIYMVANAINWRTPANTIPGAALDLANKQFDLYNTNDGTNYERAGLRWVSNVVEMFSESGGTGVARAIRLLSADTLVLGAGGAARMFVNAAGHLTASTSNAYDIGSAPAQFRSGYFGTSVIAPKFYASETAASGGFDLFQTSPGGYGVFRESTTTVLKGAGGVALNIGASSLLLVTASRAQFNIPITGNANIIDQRNGTSAQIFRVYNTYTDGTNFERLDIAWASNEARVVTSSQGTGSSRNLVLGTAGNNGVINFVQNNATRWTINASGHFVPGADNSNDLGISPATRLRSAFFGTSVVTPVVMGESGVLEQRNSGQAQTFNVYNTYTDAANYERLAVLWSGNIAHVFTQQGGTGTARELRIGTSGGAALSLYTNNTLRWQVTAGGTPGHLLAGVDNAYDIGASGASRPRIAYIGTRIELTGQAALRGAGGAIEVRAAADAGYADIYSRFQRSFALPVASLPAPSAGSQLRGFASDSTVAASGNFGAAVVGGGSNVVPVYSDGTNWRIG